MVFNVFCFWVVPWLSCACPDHAHALDHAQDHDHAADDDDDDDDAHDDDDVHANDDDDDDDDEEDEGLRCNQSLVVSSCLC